MSEQELREFKAAMEKLRASPFIRAVWGSSVRSVFVELDDSTLAATPAVPLAEGAVITLAQGAAGLRFSIMRPFNIVSSELPATVALILGQAISLMGLPLIVAILLIGGLAAWPPCAGCEEFCCGAVEPAELFGWVWAAGGFLSAGCRFGDWANAAVCSFTSA
jgi:hypothetical protein